MSTKEKTLLQDYAPRFANLLGGLAVSAVGIVMMLQANVGLEPWSVLHQGMAQSMGISYGTASIIVGGVAVGAAAVCGEGFGIGTIANIVICAMLIDLLLATGLIPQMSGIFSGLLMLAAGLELLALGTWLYMRARLGAGPRDALMVALARNTRRSVGLCRAVVELIAIAVGWWLGGPVGIGTVVAAVGLGSLFNLNFRLLRFPAATIRQENLAQTLRKIRGHGKNQ